MSLEKGATTEHFMCCELQSPDIEIVMLRHTYQLYLVIECELPRH